MASPGRFLLIPPSVVKQNLLLAPAPPAGLVVSAVGEVAVVGGGAESFLELTEEGGVDDGLEGGGAEGGEEGGFVAGGEEGGLVVAGGGGLVEGGGAEVGGLLGGFVFVAPVLVPTAVFTRHVVLSVVAAVSRILNI